MTSRESSDPDPYAEHPEDSIFPGAGRRVSDEELEAAITAGLMGATVGDEEDTEEVEGADED